MSPSIKYYRTEGETKTDTIHWKFPHFINSIKCKHNREFRTDKSEDRSDEKTDMRSRFLVKMQCLGRESEIIEIYFMPPIADRIDYLKSTMCCKDSNTNVSQEYRAVPANKWQYLATLSTACIRGQYLRNGHILNLDFVFQVIVDHQINMQHLGEDLLELLNNGLFSDIIIKSVEGIEYKVHKAVLASRSAVLKAHFEHNTTECFTNLLESPLESDVLQEVLTFIYGDKAPQIDDIPEKLLVAADYYQLSKLKRLCEEALQNKLTVDNAMEILQLADVHSANDLKQFTLGFIKDGQAKLITKTEGWAKATSVDLIKSICEYLVTDENDDDDDE